MDYMRIKELREAIGMPQVRLAALVGVSPNVVSNWETGVALPRSRDLPRLAYVLETNIDDLYTDEAKTFSTAS